VKVTVTDSNLQSVNTTVNWAVNSNLPNVDTV